MESLRYHDERLKVNTIISLHSANTIPPLLYLTLVENAFKHGAGKTSEPTEITIQVQTDEKHSVFKIENTFSPNQAGNEKAIGLQNIQRQLQHQYSGNFTFNFSQENLIFKVEIITPSQHD